MNLQVIAEDQVMLLLTDPEDQVMLLHGGKHDFIDETDRVGGSESEVVFAILQLLRMEPGPAEQDTFAEVVRDLPLHLQVELPMSLIACQDVGDDQFVREPLAFRMWVEQIQ